MCSALSTERKEGITRPGGLGSPSGRMTSLKDEQNFTRVQQPFCKGRPIMNTEFKIPYFYMTGKHMEKERRKYGRRNREFWRKERGKEKDYFFKT